MCTDTNEVLQVSTKYVQETQTMNLKFLKSEACRTIFSCVIKQGTWPNILGTVTSTWEESCFDFWQKKEDFIFFRVSGPALLTL
jgi:hypothetical protein